MEEYSGPVRAAFFAAYDRETATSDTIAALAAKLRPRRGGKDSHYVTVLGIEADALAGLGRLSEANLVAEALAALAPQESGRALAWPILLGMQPTPAVGTRIDSAMRAMHPGAEAAYARTVVALSRGHVAEVRREKLDTTPGLYRGLVTAAQGWADLLAGDTTAGLERMREGLEDAAMPRAHSATALMRFHYAMALAARDETRADGIRRLRYGFVAEPILRPLSYLELGRAYDAAGETDSAAHAFTRFLRLWDKADPAVQGKVGEAREALRRLTAEPRL
jgi:hypothetical protein